MSAAETPAARPRRRGLLQQALRRRGLLPRPLVLRALTHLCQCLPTRGNHLQLFQDGDALYLDMLAAIAGARERISLEMYMFLSDATGWRFAHALAERAQAGIAVRVVIDSLGSFGISSALLRHLTEAGVQLIEYRPVAPWRRRFALFRRNHRKLLVVDGRIGYTGGVNLADFWTGRRRGGGNWKDAHVRVEGPAAGDLEVFFADTWYRETNVLLDLPRPAREEVDSSFDTADAQVYALGSRGTGQRRMRRLYLLALGHARRRIFIAQSYFVPDRKVRRALRHARARGLQVTLLLPAHSDVPVAQFASESLLQRMLDQGIEIYRWTPSVLHSKYAVVDDEWWTLGSSNLDNLSFRLNLEANLVVLDPTTGATLTHRFQRDLRCAERLDPDQWRRRPWTHKLRERLAYLFHPLL